MVDKLVRSEEEWRRLLPPERFRVLREAGTEPPFDNEYDGFWGHGAYACYACARPLFRSDDKFHSGTGWPSFTRPIGPDAVEEHRDATHGMVRTEVRCARCGSHLGHVFDDGPSPVGLRYCMNSASLIFLPEEQGQGGERT